MRNILAVAGYMYVHKDVHRGESMPLDCRDFATNFAFRKYSWFTVFLMAAALVVLPSRAAGQASAAQARITSPVNDNALTTLRGNTHPLARAQYDQGAAADSQPMHRMLLLLRRSPAQDAALKTLLDEQHSAASPNYHQWLTPQQFGQQFGPADADVQTVTTWLQSHGFQVARVSNARTMIEFSGTAGQVRNAFHTEVHRYSVNGEQRFANNSDPQIPTVLLPVVAGPVSLNNFPKKPASHTLGTFRKTKESGLVAPLYTFSGCTTVTGPGSNCNAVGPGDFAAIYNVAKLWNPGISGTAIDGTGQTIAIVGDSEICTAKSPDFNIPGYSYTVQELSGTFVTATCSTDDVAAFRTLFGLPANSPNVILDGPDPGFNGDEIEGDLDVEWSGAVAKGATIDFVIAEGTEATAGTDLAAEYIVDNNLAPVLSESFTTCEFNLQNDGNAFESVLWEQAAAQGITVIVAAGDSGSANCDDPDTQNAATQFGAAVNGIASTPFNVAAGGTDFDITAANYQSTYWGGGNSTDTSGVKDVSATTYIPETTWNDSCAQNFTGALTGCTPTNGGIVAGGGGQSNCAEEDGSGNCYYYAKPSWQTVASGSGLNVANDLARDIPDISLFAADGLKSNSFYVLCEADLTGGPCNLSTPYFDFVGVGGTSSAAPTFAGIMALVNENLAVNHSVTNPRQGNANYVLYNLAAAQTTSAINCNSSSTSISSSCTFNDVTKGNNSVPCLPQFFDGIEYDGCSSTTAGVYGVVETDNVNTGALTGNIAWNTAAGLDLATGLGSVNAYNLVNNWANAGPFAATTTTLCLSLTQTSSASCSGPLTGITHGQTVYVNMQVDAAGFPNGIPVSEQFPTGTSAATDVPTLTEDVSLVGTFSSANPSCTNGATPPIQVSGCNTGAVDLFTSNDYVISNADYYALTSGTTVGQNYGTNSLVGGTYSVVAHYGGDGHYGGSNSAPITITVNPEGSTASLSGGAFTPAGAVISTSVPYGYTQFESFPFSTVVRVDVTGNSSGQENATGTVTLTDSVNSGTRGPILGPTGAAAATFNLNTEGYLEDQTAFLAVGTHSFQATFNGDASYSASTASSTLAWSVTQASTAITSITATPTTVASGHSVTLTALVDTTIDQGLIGSTGLAPTGTVTFYNNGTAIGSPVSVTSALDSYGFVAAQASASPTLSASGSITAIYNGDTNYAASPRSSGVNVTVGTGGVNLSENNATITVSSPGQTSSQTLITAMSANSFAGAITLVASVTAAPSGAIDYPNCTFGAPDSNFTSPNTITLTSGGSGTATMTCTTTAAAMLFTPSNRPLGHDWPLAAGLASLISFAMLLAIPRQRRWRLAPFAALVVILVAVAAGCSGGGSSSGGGGTGGSSGTTTGGYTVTVTASSSGSTVGTTTITVNVN